MKLPAYNAFVAHAIQDSPAECCGLVVGDVYRPCRNMAPLGHFEVNAEDWDAAEDAGTIQAVCHSHPEGSASPGAADVDQCRESGLPWFILGQSGDMQRLDPEPIPLLGRPFVDGWQDCYSLARDYFGGLPEFPREDEFWAHGHSPFLDHFAACGFREVSEAQAGDALLMRFHGGSIPHHCGVYLGKGEMLHHPRNQFSRIEQWGRYMAHTTHILRRTA